MFSSDERAAFIVPLVLDTVTSSAALSEPFISPSPPHVSSLMFQTSSGFIASVALDKTVSHCDFGLSISFLRLTAPISFTCWDVYPLCTSSFSSSLVMSSLLALSSPVSSNPTLVCALELGLGFTISLISPLLNYFSPLSSHSLIPFALEFVLFILSMSPISLHRFLSALLDLSSFISFETLLKFV